MQTCPVHITKIMTFHPEPPSLSWEPHKANAKQRIRADLTRHPFLSPGDCTRFFTILPFAELKTKLFSLVDHCCNQRKKNNPTDFKSDVQDSNAVSEVMQWEQDGTKHRHPIWTQDLSAMVWLTPGLKRANEEQWRNIMRINLISAVVHRGRSVNYLNCSICRTCCMFWGTRDGTWGMSAVTLHNCDCQ